MNALSVCAPSPTSSTASASKTSNATTRPYIQGVRVLYDAAGTPQRDETAFRHALKTAHRAHKRDQRLKDNLIIDAYEHAYRIANA